MALAREISRAVLVSILVFVELALDGHCSGHCVLIFFVSILVFVELALDGDNLETTVCSGYGFNPCFRGTCS